MFCSLANLLQAKIKTIIVQSTSFYFLFYSGYLSKLLFDRILHTKEEFLRTLYRVCIIYIDTRCINYYPNKAGLPNFKAGNNLMQVGSQKI